MPIFSPLGPGSGDDYAAHGNSTRGNKSYGINPVQLIGGSSCSNPEGKTII